jgi:hypothetical protein
MDHCTDPWNVAVPVVPGRFAAQRVEHAALAVQVDLGAIGAFGFDRPVPGPEQLLYADLQSNPDSNAPGRLGSGRAGFYRGYYLKGIGRTTLAGNWSDPQDAYHNSGHQLPSAAVREYLVSVYLEACGLGHTIVPCQGLLLGQLPAAAERYVLAMLPGRDAGSIEPVDRRLQAISVKPAGFARFSNFLWALGHARPGLAWTVDFWQRVRFYLGAAAEGDGSAGALVTGLARAIERGCAHFAAFVRAGVYWGSFHNNFTADGRFLDLETPVVFGRPFIGLLAESQDALTEVDLASGQRLLCGLELFHHVRQLRAFVRHLASHLVLRQQCGFRLGAAEDAFLGELREALHELLGPGHLLFDGEALKARLHAELCSALALPPAERAYLERVIEAQYDGYFIGHTGRTLVSELRPLPLALAPVEPTFAARAYCLARLAEPMMERLELGRSFQAALHGAGRQVDSAGLLHHLDEVAVELRRGLRSARPQHTQCWFSRTGGVSAGSGPNCSG